MYINETYAKKWAPVLDHPELPKITDNYKRAVTALVLENQERALMEENRSMHNLWEASPANAMGTAGISGLSSTVNTGVTGFDPILIGLVRRALPNLMAYDICGVQPMTGPTGLIFAMRSVYASSTARAGEALFAEANNAHSGNGTMTAFSTTVNPGNADSSIYGLANTGYGFTTAYSEDATLQYMGFQIDRVAVTANTRGLQAAYTLELA